MFATLKPPYRTSLDQPAYSIPHVEDIFDTILAMARFRNAAAETISLIERHRDTFLRSFK